MNNELARTILALKKDGASVVYGEASALNTVSLEGAATAVELPALSPVVAGDYCAVLQQGADRLILGPIGGGPLIAFGTETGTTTAAGALQITHGLSWTPSVAFIAPVAPNGASAATRFTGHGAVSMNSTFVTVGRCVDQAGAVLASTSVTVMWMAMT